MDLRNFLALTFSLFLIATCSRVQTFEVKFSGVTILQGVEIPVFLLILSWALQQCSATALTVINCNYNCNCRKVINLNHTVFTIGSDVQLCETASSAIAEIKSKVITVK